MNLHVLALHHFAAHDQAEPTICSKSACVLLMTYLFWYLGKMCCVCIHFVVGNWQCERPEVHSAAL